MSSSIVSKLDGLIGLTGAKAVVRGLAGVEQGVHAVLLYGARGTGKSELASVLIQNWLCNSPTTDGADGTCRACHSYLRGNSADLLVVAPLGPSAIIGVKQVVNDKIEKEDPPTPLLTFFRTPPLLSRHKVAWISDAHRMNGAAASALLKTLEEPHPHCKIILTTDKVGSLLPTILSRCLAVACETPEASLLRLEFPNATADEFRFSEGTPGRLKAVFERRELYEALARFCRRLLTRKAGEALIASEEFQQLAGSFQSSAEKSVRATNTEALDAMATFFSAEPGAPPEWTQRIIEAHRRIAGNGSGPLVMDALFTALLTR